MVLAERQKQHDALKERRQRCEDVFTICESLGKHEVSFDDQDPAALESMMEGDQNMLVTIGDALVKWQAWSNAPSLLGQEQLGQMEKSTRTILRKLEKLVLNIFSKRATEFFGMLMKTDSQYPSVAVAKAFSDWQHTHAAAIELFNFMRPQMDNIQKIMTTEQMDLACDLPLASAEMQKWFAACTGAFLNLRSFMHDVRAAGTEGGKIVRSEDFKYSLTDPSWGDWLKSHFKTLFEKPGGNARERKKTVENQAQLAKLCGAWGKMLEMRTAFNANKFADSDKDIAKLTSPKFLEAVSQVNSTFMEPLTEHASVSVDKFKDTLLKSSKQKAVAREFSTLITNKAWPDVNLLDPKNSDFLLQVSKHQRSTEAEDLAFCIVAIAKAGVKVSLTGKEIRIHAQVSDRCVETAVMAQRVRAVFSEEDRPQDIDGLLMRVKAGVTVMDQLRSALDAVFQFDKQTVDVSNAQGKDLVADVVLKLRTSVMEPLLKQFLKLCKYTLDHALAKITEPWEEKIAGQKIVWLKRYMVIGCHNMMADVAESIQDAKGPLQNLLGSGMQLNVEITGEQQKVIEETEKSLAKLHLWTCAAAGIRYVCIKWATGDEVVMGAKLAQLREWKKSAAKLNVTPPASLVTWMENAARDALKSKTSSPKRPARSSEAGSPSKRKRMMQ